MLSMVYMPKNQLNEKRNANILSSQYVEWIYSVYQARWKSTLSNETVKYTYM